MAVGAELVNLPAAAGRESACTPAGLIELGEPLLEIVSGANHSCARLQSGALRCWGANNFGQLGLGNRRSLGDDELPLSAAIVSLPAAARRLAAHWMQSCAVLVDGTRQDPEIFWWVRPENRHDA